MLARQADAASQAASGAATDTASGTAPLTPAGKDPSICAMTTLFTGEGCHAE